MGGGNTKSPRTASPARAAQPTRGVWWPTHAALATLSEGVIPLGSAGCGPSQPQLPLYLMGKTHVYPPPHRYLRWYQHNDMWYDIVLHEGDSDIIDHGTNLTIYATKRPEDAHNAKWRLPNNIDGDGDWRYRMKSDNQLYDVVVFFNDLRPP